MTTTTTTTTADESPDEKRMNVAAVDGKAVPTEATAPKRSAGKTALIMLALCLAVFLAALDSVVITVALPTIAREMGASDAGYAWIGSAYLLTVAALIPFWGKVSDIFGRRPMLIIANAIFMVGSLIAALSKNLTMLIAGRAVQGLGGGGLITLVNICVGDLFSPRERGMYLGIIGGIWALASSIGPVIGGAFTQRVTWRWCFWINLPIDGLSLIILTFFLDIHTPKTPLIKGLKAIDWVGSVTMTGATLMFLLGLEFGGVTDPWNSAKVICLIIFGLLSYVVFGVVEKFPAYPVMPYRIFNSLSTVSVLVVVFFHGLCFIAIAFFLPLYFQLALGASPILAGVWTLPTAITLAIASIANGIVIRATGRYIEIIRGCMALLTLALGLCINFPGYPSWPRIIIFQIIIGATVGPPMQALIMAIQVLLPQQDVAVGTSTLGFVRQMATAISVVIGQVIFQSVLANHGDGLLAAGIPADLVATLSGGSSIAAADVSAALPADQGAVYDAAVADALSKVWIFYTAASAIGFLASFGIRKVTLSDQHVETKTGLQTDEEKRAELQGEAPKNNESGSSEDSPV